MKKAVNLLLVLIFICLLNGTIIEVNIDGSGDYLTIQAGINASSNGDTVLVFPGRYFENTDYNGKTIVVGSLEMTTGNRDYIHNTIIDGNQTGCCVAVFNNEAEGTILRGFTITNGIGYLSSNTRYGGGVFLHDSNLSISNCVIENNQARNGGGISNSGSNLWLEGTIIRNNSALLKGGGIASYRLENTIYYSYNNRCSIYDNFSPWGFDIYNSYENGVMTDVVVDTFTVSEPYGYEFYQGDGDFMQTYEDMVFDVQHYKYERVNADLYASPGGNDTNSGLTEDEPLLTINQALHIITADENNPRTIYLTDGIYSTIDNNQLFPISMRAYVSLIGESRDNTIIDLGIGHQGFVIDLFSELNYEVKNLTVRNGFVDDDDASYLQGFFLSNRLDYDGLVVLENIKMENNEYSPLVFAGNMNIVLRNIIFNNYQIDTNCVSFSFAKRGNDDKSVLMENCQTIFFEGGSQYISSNENLEPENLRIDIVNSEFSNHLYHNQSTPNFTVGLSIFGFGGMDLNIVNCTFTENHLYGPSIGSAPVRICYSMDVDIINSIFYNNTSHSVIIDGYSGYMPIVNMHHNIIENGLDGILTSSAYILNWDEETNWDVDPLFMNEGDYPYSFQQYSPAIDMGTLDLPEGVVLPEYDLAGNPRIMGNGIDLGAYEYNPYSHPVDVDDEMGIADFEYYPNPVRLHEGRGAVMINFEGRMEEDDYKIGIYNVKGQKVWESELCRGYDGIRWDCCDANGLKVAAGVYFLRLSRDGEYLSQGKLTVIK